MISTCTDGQLNSQGNRVYKVRLGTTKDVDSLLIIAEKFYNTTEICELIPFHVPSVRNQIYRSIAKGFIVIGEKDGEMVGVLGCDLLPYSYNTDYTVCMESMFWMAPEVRGSYLAVRMLNEAEGCAKVLGAELFMMARIPTSPKSTDGWYKKQGYKESDVLYIKKLRR